MTSFAVSVADDGLTKRLSAFTLARQRSIVRRGVVAGASIVNRTARANVRAASVSFDDSSGALLRSVGVVRPRTGRGAKANRITAFVRPRGGFKTLHVTPGKNKGRQRDPQFYARFIEGGVKRKIRTETAAGFHPGFAARPMFGPAFRTTGPVAMNRARDIMLRGIEAAVAKGGGDAART